MALTASASMAAAFAVVAEPPASARGAVCDWKGGSAGRLVLFDHHFDKHFSDLPGIILIVR